MKPAEYVRTIAKFTRTKRHPEDLHLMALAATAGAQGFRMAQAMEMTGLSYEELKSSVESLKKREILDQVGAAIVLTIKGEKEVEKYFPPLPERSFFETAMGWIARLVDSDSPSDFRNANAFLAKVQSETGKSYE